jgi:hypothetical protein
MSRGHSMAHLRWKVLHQHKSQTPPLLIYRPFQHSIPVSAETPGSPMTRAHTYNLAASLWSVALARLVVLIGQVIHEKSQYQERLTIFKYSLSLWNLWWHARAAEYRRLFQPSPRDQSSIRQRLISCRATHDISSPCSTEYYRVLQRGPDQEQILWWIQRRLTANICRTTHQIQTSRMSHVTSNACKDVQPEDYTAQSIFPSLAYIVMYVRWHNQLPQ